MSAGRIKVPEFIKAAIRGSARFLDTGNPALCEEQVEAVGKAVCEAISKNPIVPTEEQIRSAALEAFGDHGHGFGATACKNGAKHFVALQRRMFLSEEEDLPAQVKEFLDRLFRDGAGNRARRLVLEGEKGQNLGGWCKEAVRDQLIASLGLQDRNKETK